MTGVLTCSAKISFGSLTSPCRAPAESKRGASRWSASVLAAAAFFGAVFRVVVVLVVVFCSAITRGPRKIEDFLGPSDLPTGRFARGALQLHPLRRLTN